MTLASLMSRRSCLRLDAAWLMRVAATHRLVGPTSAHVWVSTSSAASARGSTQGSAVPSMQYLAARLRRLRGAQPPSATPEKDDEDLCASTPRQSNPTHLFFLVHGLGGRPEDLSALSDVLQHRGGSTGGVLVHLARANQRRLYTYDGIQSGGSRLATELRSLVSAHPGLTHVSLVGNSLGGLYCRYAAALLWEPESKTIAGLRPVSFLTTASPHLGVGQHGHLRIIPRPLQHAGGALLGTSIKQLLLLDDATSTVGLQNSVVEGLAQAPAPLLLRMGTDEAFLAPLRAFSRRHVYANAVNDFLVAYETAAFSLNGLPKSQLRPERSGNPTTMRLNRGPRVLFTKHRPPSDTEQQQQQQFSGTSASSARSRGADVAAWQAAMARGLGTMGWNETAVAFPGLLPLAHNRIVALRRDPVLTWINACGMAVVEHTADTLLSAARDATGVAAEELADEGRSARADGSLQAA
jgi:pimeloyl-ACP methyl ester carboxylesterase